MARPKDEKRPQEAVQSITKPSKITSEAEKEVRTKELADLAGQLQSTADDLQSELGKKTTEWSETVGRFNEALRSVQSLFSQTVAGLIEKSNQIFAWFFKEIQKLTSWLYVMILLSCVAVSAADWGLFPGNLAQLLLATLVPAIVLLLLAHFSGKWIRDKIYSDSHTVGAAQSSMKEGLGVFKGKAQEAGIDLANFKTLTNRLVKISGQITTALTSYLTALHEFYEERDRQRKTMYQEEEIIQRQRNFVTLLRGAILTFAIPIDEKTMEYLDKFHSQFNNPEKWIDEASAEISKRSGVGTQIVKLFFFDYSKDLGGLKATWDGIKRDTSALEMLARITVANEVKEYANPEVTGNYRAIVALIDELKEFRISEFRSLYYEFYVNLAQTKTSLIEALTQFGIEIPETDRRRFREFTPTSVSQREWEEEVFQSLGPLIGKDATILGLLYYESAGKGAQAQNIWEKILASTERQRVLDELAGIILDYQLKDIPEIYRQQRNVLVRSIEEVAGRLDPFSIAKIKEQVTGTFDRLDANKRALSLALSRFGILLEPNQAEKFNVFVPESDDIGALCAEFSRLVNESRSLTVDPGFVLLFYDHHMQRPEEIETFAALKSKSLALATILLQRKIIKHELDTDLAIEARKLSAVVESVDHFDPVLIQRLYQTYGELMAISDKLVRFLQKEGLVHEGQIIFSQLVKLMHESGADTHLAQVRVLCDFLLKSVGNLKTNEEDYRAAVQATTCYFLVSQQDFAAGEACKETGTLTTATRILYRNMEQRESETFGRESATLASAVDYVTTNPTATFRFIEDFTTGLKSERLYRSTKDLLGAKVDDLKEQMTHVSELQATIDSMEQSVKDFMNTELPEDFLLYAIDAQLIQAYMVSTQSGQAIMSDILERMKKICSPDSKNVKYRRLLLFTEEKTKGGYYTRMGVVPSRLEFEEFSKLFDEVFKLAVSKHISERNLPPEQASLFSANVFRLFASPLAFKLITGTAKSAEEIDAAHPIRQIKDVIINQMGFVDNLALVASSKSERDRTVIVKKIVINLFDSKGKLLTMTQSGITDILGRHGKLREIMENRDSFDNVLMTKFGCNSFSSMALAAYKMRVSLGDKPKAIGQISQYVQEITLPQKVHLTSDESQRVGAAIEVVLDNIGRVLQY
jgi:hypothetical protein